MTPDHAQLPPPRPSTRLNALWGRGSKALFAVAALAAGGLAGAAVPGNAARTGPEVCLPPNVCTTITTPTVTTPTVPTVSLPLSTGATSTTTSTPTGDPATAANQTTSTSQNESTSSANLTFQLGVSVRKQAHRRWLEIRVSLSQAARIRASLLRPRTVVARARYAANEGPNRLLLYVPARTKPGKAQLKLLVFAATAQRQIVRSVVLPSR